MLKDIGIKFEKLVIIYCDKKSTISMSKNLIFHFNTKHIAIKYHVLREKVAEKDIRLEYVNTKEQITDIFTNSLPNDTFEYLRGILGVMPLPSSK